MAGAHDYADRLDRAGPGEAGTPPPVVRIVEALLFAAGEPLSAETACDIVRGLTAESFRDAVNELSRQYRRQNRPYAVQARPAGYVLALKPSFQGLKARLTGGPREARLSQPALDVLAVVAYKQPVTRGEVDSLRGHDSAALLRQLVRLGLVAVGKDSAYATTPRFLELFGLKSLDDLPQTSDLQKI
jgi:segregation and condensation protein B